MEYVGQLLCYASTSLAFLAGWPVEFTLNILLNFGWKADHRGPVKAKASLKSKKKIVENVIKLFPVNFIACWKWFRTGIVQLARGNDGGKGRRFIEPL